jgi:hypothetical protein
MNGDGSIGHLRHRRSHHRHGPLGSPLPEGRTGLTGNLAVMATN